MQTQETVLETKNLNKSFYDPIQIDVLKDISFQLKSEEFVSIIGKSGCGKSTLLYLLSTMDTEYSGEIFIDKEALNGKTEKQLAFIRNKKIGFVFQFHYLLNEFNVLKNIILPGIKLAEKRQEELEDTAFKYMKILGIDHLANKKAFQISGGEKQRVAIARSLINDPLILMCDEPTGNLDSKNTEIVFEIFSILASEFKKTLLIVTHDLNFAKKTGRIITMEDGQML